MSSSTRHCPDCGAEYLGWVQRCAECGAPLADDPSDTAADAEPFDVPEEQQVVYELGEWPDEARGELAEVLSAAGVAHSWETTDLIVHEDDEAQLDQLTEAIEERWRGEAGLPAADGPSADRRVEVEYDLSEWTPEMRNALGQQLDGVGIAYSWVEAALVVDGDDEEQVEELLDQAEYPDALEAQTDTPVETEADDEAAFELMSQLFLASDKLATDPTDSWAVLTLNDAATEGEHGRAPYGVNAGLWADVLKRAERLRALLNDPDLDEDAVGDEAHELRTILRELV